MFVQRDHANNFFFAFFTIVDSTKHCVKKNFTSSQTSQLNILNFPLFASFFFQLTPSAKPGKDGYENPSHSS